MELFYSKNITGSKIILPEDETRHCVKVLRNKPGDTVYVIDGEGGLYRCKLLGAGKEAECEIAEKSVGIGKRNYSLTMAVCPTKNIERYEWFLEKATEFGIDKLVPLISEHSIRTRIKRERLEAIALSATKQSLKAYLPVIEDEITVADFLKGQKISGLPVNKNSRLTEEKKSDSSIIKLIAHCEEAEKISLRSALNNRGCLSNTESSNAVSRNAESGKTMSGNADNESCSKPEITIMIGPEGDFSKKEIELAADAGFSAITLGTARLRVETAALAAVTEVYFSKS
jgi:16S rRNA (uracil1498-N3)-methyltransferase